MVNENNNLAIEKQTDTDKIAFISNVLIIYFLPIK